MILFQDTQDIKQLPKIRGSYYYVALPSKVVKAFSYGRNTRLICNLDGHLDYRCGLNHLGDGNYFIIIGGDKLKSLEKELGQEIEFSVSEDPDQLGVDMPEVLIELLEIDEGVRTKYNDLSMGKKRHVIHAMNRLKSLDRQVAKAINLIELHSKQSKNKRSGRKE